MARKASSEPDFDRELADLPPELRWREWMGRVEAVIFAAAEPVTREVLARVVGKGCKLDLLIDEDLDYAANTPDHRTYPKGLDVEVMRSPCLLRAAREAKAPYEREHVTPYLIRRPELFSQAIRLAQGNQAKAARWLGVTRLKMREKLIELGLHPGQDAKSKSPPGTSVG